MIGYENHLIKLASALKGIGYNEQAATLVKLAAKYREPEKTVEQVGVYLTQALDEYYKIVNESGSGGFYKGNDEPIAGKIRASAQMAWDNSDSETWAKDGTALDDIMTAVRSVEVGKAIDSFKGKSPFEQIMKGGYFQYFTHGGSSNAARDKWKLFLAYYNQWEDYDNIVKNLPWWRIRKMDYDDPDSALVLQKLSIVDKKFMVDSSPDGKQWTGPKVYEHFSTTDFGNTWKKNKPAFPSATAVKRDVTTDDSGGDKGDSDDRRDDSNAPMAELTGSAITDTDTGNKFRAWVNNTHSQWAKDNQLDAENNRSDGWNNKWIRKAWSTWGAEYKETLPKGDTEAVAEGAKKPGETTGASGATDNYDHLIKYLMVPKGTATTNRDALGWREGAKPAFEEDKARRYIGIDAVRGLVEPAYEADKGDALTFALAEINLTNKALGDATDAISGETTGGKTGKTGAGTAGGTGSVKDYFWSKKDNVYMRKSDGALFYAATTDDGMSLKGLNGRVLDPNEDGENFLNDGEQRRIINEIKRETNDKDLIDLYRSAIVGSRMANNKTFLGIGKEKHRAKGYQKVQDAATALKAYHAQN